MVHVGSERKAIDSACAATTFVCRTFQGLCPPTGLPAVTAIRIVTG